MRLIAGLVVLSLLVTIGLPGTPTYLIHVSEVSERSLSGGSSELGVGCYAVMLVVGMSVFGHSLFFSLPRLKPARR